MDPSTPGRPPVAATQAARSVSSWPTWLAIAVRARRSRSNGSSIMVPPSGEGAVSAQALTWRSSGTAGLVPPMTPRSRARATPMTDQPPFTSPSRH